MYRNVFTIEEHLAISAELLAIREKLITLVCDCYNRGGTLKRRVKTTNLAKKALAAVDGLRSQMEERGFDAFPDKFSIHVYYPGQGKPRL